MSIAEDATRLPDRCRTLPEAVEFWARERPDSPALIVAAGPTIAYSELWERVRRHAEALQDRGVARDACIILLLPDGPLLATAILGAASAAVAFALDAATPVAELERLLSRIPIGAVIAAPDLAEPARDLFTRNQIPVVFLPEDPEAPATSPSGEPLLATLWESPSPTDIATIGQTSGTTGKPKLIPRTHDHITRSGREHGELFGLTPHDRALAVAPMSLSLGKTALLHTVCAGSSLIFPASFAPDRIRQAIEDERPTWMHSAAGFLEVLVRYLRDHPPDARSSLRFVRVTAAAISPAVCDELERYLGAPVLPAYSTSETGVVATALPTAGCRRPGSVGKPVQDVRIVAEDGQDVPAGREGEIWIRGRKIIDGYLDDTALNARAFTPDGWFRIGDAGYLDADGFLFLTGRVNELINRGGLKISPAEIDAVLLAHPAVCEAATFAVPDARLGEDIVAAVVLEPGRSPTPRELRGWMLDRLAPHKVPRRIWFADDGPLPRTPSGKVRRAELAQRFLGRRPATPP
jgi:oxalate---CoA ligase